MWDNIYIYKKKKKKKKKKNCVSKAINCMNLMVH